VLLIEIQHPTPFYDDSYAVNSANNGPYGDAIEYELIPEIEKRYRAIGAGWARFMYGGSTGGWEAMAVQMFYPDDYNGAWIACPDPIDFRHYMVVDIYRDKNAYFMPNPYKRTPRPAHRNWLGHISTTMEENNLWEYALGTHGRSGDQFDAWESVYSPVGPDGYPRRIWNRLTGEIDHETAEYWHEHYDLFHILQRDWATLGPKLRGKLRIYVGDMDNYYLNNAVYGVEKFLKGAAPPADAVVEYGDRDEHCWNGDHARANAYSRLRYPQMVLPWGVVWANCGRSSCAARFGAVGRLCEQAPVRDHALVQLADRVACLGTEGEWQQPVQQANEAAADHPEGKAPSVGEVLEVAFADRGRMRGEQVLQRVHELTTRYRY
jgi:hypothetical protein